MPPKVLVLMGSDKDMPIMQAAAPYFTYFGVEADFVVSSAHRNPERTAKLASEARDTGYSAIICGAGMAAHLAGVCSAYSDLPVIGVPLAGGIEDGLDALLATVQMPAGVPVATLAVGKAGAINAAVLTARILSLSHPAILENLISFRRQGCRLAE
jgi:phosphoribosylaminoimidazole carboxylase PurE protein